MTDKFQCKYCEKNFSLEKTLASHMCVKKRRYLDKDSVGSRIGFHVFQKFYQLNSSSKKPRTFDDFINSQYYTGFVKFGRYIVQLNPINVEEFILFVIKNGVKLKDWTKDYVYETYLIELQKKETVEKALERTVLTIETWSKENNKDMSSFFKEVNTNEATFLIKSGHISPWVLYLANTSDSLFSRFNEEQVKIIQTCINPTFWNARFSLKKDDVEFVRNILNDAKL